MRVPARRSLSRKQGTAQSHKDLDQEQQTKIPQRDSFSLSKTSFSPERAERCRGPSVSLPQGARPKHVGGSKGQWRRKKRQAGALPASSKKRIRSGGKREGCTTPEANAAELRIPNEMLRGRVLLVVTE